MSKFKTWPIVALLASGFAYLSLRPKVEAFKFTIPKIEPLTGETLPTKIDKLDRFALDKLDPMEATLVFKVWSRLQPFIDIVAAKSIKHGVPTTLIYAIIFMESSIHPNTKIWEPNVEQFAMGLGQVLPSTARWMGFKGTDEELLKPEVNLEYVAKYLRYQLDRYENDIPEAIAAYNAGSVKYREDGSYINQAYVNRVSRYFNMFNQSLYKA